MNRKYYSSNTKWEPLVGYSRALKVGNVIYISGTTATENGKIIGINNPYEQTVQIIKNIENALKSFSANLSHIVRTRIYVTNIEMWEDIGRAHGKFFNKIRPATSMVEVNRLISPEILVEIEADAVID